MAVSENALTHRGLVAIFERLYATLDGARDERRCAVLCRHRHGAYRRRMSVMISKGW
jgi:hypothetical protein